MDIIATLNKAIIILKSLRPNVEQINDITLPVINVVNALASVRDELASQQEHRQPTVPPEEQGNIITMTKECFAKSDREENHENDHNEERDV